MTSQADLPDADSDILPPVSQIGFLGWVRRNLFSTWYNGLLTILLAYALVRLLVPFLVWSVIHAQFLGTSEASCTRDARVYFW